MELHLLIMLIISLPNIDCLNPQKSKATNLKKAKAYQNQKIFHFHSNLYILLELKLSTNLHEHLKS